MQAKSSGVPQLLPWHPCDSACIEEDVWVAWKERAGRPLAAAFPALRQQPLTSVEDVQIVCPFGLATSIEILGSVTRRVSVRAFPRVCVSSTRRDPWWLGLRSKEPVKSWRMMGATRCMRAAVVKVTHPALIDDTPDPALQSPEVRRTIGTSQMMLHGRSA